MSESLDMTDSWQVSAVLDNRTTFFLYPTLPTCTAVLRCEVIYSPLLAAPNSTLAAAGEWRRVGHEDSMAGVSCYASPDPTKIIVLGCRRTNYVGFEDKALVRSI